MRKDFTMEVEAAVTVARSACKLIRGRASGLDSSAVREKGRHDLVTEVDLLSQELIIDMLQDDFPQYGFLAEEGQDVGGTSGADRIWVIDPIDGTTNFTHGVPPYSVSIALLDRNDVVVGVVVEVVSGETFTAVRGEGSYVDGRRMLVSDTSSVEEALISTGFPYRSVGHLDEYLAVLRSFMVRSLGVRRHGSAAIDLAYLAAGRFDGFFETGLMAWDVAAGKLLIEEAGGLVSTFTDSGNAIFDGQILASNGRLHDAMLEAVRPLAMVFD